MRPSFTGRVAPPETSVAVGVIYELYCCPRFFRPGREGYRATGAQRGGRILRSYGESNARLTGTTDS